MDETADDPWADAVITSNNNNNNEATAKSSFQLNPPETTQRAEDDLEDVDPDSCGFNVFYQGIQVWHFLDVVLGFLLVLYGSLLTRSSHNVDTIVVALVLFVGCLVFLRAICGVTALCSESTCQRFGLTLSAGTSPILACTWFVLMCINLFAPGHVHNYLAQHHLLYAFLETWEATHRGTLTLLLLGAFVLECARWQLVLRLHHKLYSLEAMADARSRERAERRIRLPDRPWWWSHRSFSRGRGRGRNGNDELDPDDPLTDSLLPISADRRGESTSNNDTATRSWTLFGRRRHNNDYDREEASVDFASVQEEWASRTEEDPYWWSREEDDNNSRTPPTREVSWANEGNKR